MVPYSKADVCWCQPFGGAQHPDCPTHGTGTLPGMAEDVDRQAESAAELSGEELTAKLREPLADISKRTGKLEKDSPLFFGTGENPGLFNQPADLTEYCQACRTYHNRPTWPAPCNVVLDRY